MKANQIKLSILREERQIHHTKPLKILSSKAITPGEKKSYLSKLMDE